MNTGDFINILQHPEHLEVSQISDVQSVISEFPYFQPARAVYLKGLKTKESFKYNQELKTTAAFTTDRSVLFDFITSEEFDQNTISEKIKQNFEHVKDIELYDIEDMSVNKSVSINEALKQHIKEAEPILEAVPIVTITESVEEKSEVKIEQPEQTPEEQLDLGKPLEFDRSELHSFGEWLKITSFKPIIRDTLTTHHEIKKTEDSRSKKNELIDKFIEANPKIQPIKTEGTIYDLAKTQKAPTESLMTETLARIYLEQKNYEKAIQAYKILSLKYPEKSGFFADQIQAIKVIQEQNK